MRIQIKTKGYSSYPYLANDESIHWCLLLFLLYVTTLSLTGGIGILLFTFQHNFKNSYATDTNQVDYHRAALEGTSFFIFPRILNWFTADTGHHHVHHLSSSIPNYQLAKCHNDLFEDFKNVTQIRLKDIPNSMHFLLWDKEKRQIVSTKDHE
jgi:omega-6 fatty acid desaturase (delta-12 desaturase)